MAPFVLKFKGNKSFSPFSNIADSDSLTRTWKVCTKIASHLEQGQRLENLSWRLWHLQNLIVESDNAKSKREFKKLSKWMGDRLDKDKGRSIEELEAPDFKRTDSSDKIRQRAEEKERNRDNHTHGGGNSMKGMQYTFALDTNVRGRPAAAKKIDTTKPYPKRPVASSAGNITPKPTMRGPNAPKGASPDMTMRELSPVGGSSNPRPDGVSLRFPTLFSNDFGPTALLCPPPTISCTLSYGDASYSNNSPDNSDSFGVSRPTFEFGLDEILGSDHSLSPNEMQQDLPSTPATTTTRITSPVPSHPPTRASLISPVNAIPSTSASTTHSAPVATPASLPPLVIPKTANPAALGFSPFAESYGEVSATSPTKAVRQGPSATPPARGAANNANGGAPVNHGNTAPGGVKSECSNCGATHTPLWRRGLNDELNCNACGLYCKLHKRPRPRTLRNTHGDAARGAGWGGRNGESEIVGDPVQCYNCSTTATPLWRKDDEGNTLCNACGLYLKLHGSKRPLSMKSDVIRKRSRHDTEKRPSTSATPNNNSPPSASPGASRRTSTTPPPQSEPFAGPSPNEMQYQFPEYDFASESELMGALGGGGGPNEMNYSAFAPFAPEFIGGYSEQSTGNTAEKTSSADSGNDRGLKRRRLSEASDYSTSNGLQSPRQGPQDHPSNASNRSNHSPASSLALSLHHSPTSPNYSISALPFPSYEMYNQQNQSSGSHSGTPISSSFHPPMTGLWDNYHPPMNLLRENFHPPMQLIPEDSPQLPPSYMASGVHPPMMLPASYFFEGGEEDGNNATNDQHMLSLVNDEHDHEMSSFLMDPNGDGGVKSEYEGVSVRAGDKRGFSQGN